MDLSVFTHASGYDHRPPEGHPERVERLQAVDQAIASSGLTPVTPDQPASRTDLERVHVAAMIETIYAAVPAIGDAAIDADTWMSPGSLQAGLDAAGIAIAATKSVLKQGAGAAFAACRPPGHHAEPDRSMGFCLFNNIAIAAAWALDQPGIERVGIIDIDVHHGNGTQAWAETEPRVLFASIHQGWIYPGTGAAHETGRHGNIINVPMQAGTQGQDWLQALDHQILSRFRDEEFDLLFVSAGFDGHTQDPLAGLDLTEADYAKAGAQLAALVQSNAKGRLVCTLEGGYDLGALESSVLGFLRAIKAT